MVWCLNNSNLNLTFFSLRLTLEFKDEIDDVQEGPENSGDRCPTPGSDHSEDLSEGHQKLYSKIKQQKSKTKSNQEV